MGGSAAAGRRLPSRGRRGIGVWGNVITAIATLSGVFIAQWHARKMRRLDLHEERRVEQRKALAEVLATGRE